MSFSDEYKAGLTGNYGPATDTLSYSFQMGQKDRERGIREGTRKSGGALGGLASGPFVFMVVVLLAIGGFLLAWITYPIAGILTGIVFAVTAFFLQDMMNGLMQIFTLAVPCYIVFRFAIMLEHKVGRFKLYRIFRQCWRIFAGTGLVHALARRLHADTAGGAPMDAYVIDVVLTSLAPFAFYLNSLRLDVKNNHPTVRFKWIDLILTLVKNRFVRPATDGIRETAVLQGQDPKNRAAMSAQVAGDRVTIGNVNVPVGNIQRTAYGRHNRGWLGLAGVVLLFIFGGSILRGSTEEVPGFISQVFAIAGFTIAVLLLFWAFLPNALAGKLGGPFRFLKIFYFGENGANGGFAQMRFNDAEDEHRFISAIENGLKAMPRSDPNADAGSFQEAPAPAN